MKYKYNVSLKELRSSLKYRSREYLLQNSLTVTVSNMAFHISWILHDLNGKGNIMI